MAKDSDEGKSEFELEALRGMRRVTRRKVEMRSRGARGVRVEKRRNVESATMAHVCYNVARVCKDARSNE
jgi:hypothetical protein